MRRASSRVSSLAAARRRGFFQRRTMHGWCHPGSFAALGLGLITSPANWGQVWVVYHGRSARVVVLQLPELQRALPRHKRQGRAKNQRSRSDLPLLWRTAHWAPRRLRLQILPTRETASGAAKPQRRLKRIRAASTRRVAPFLPVPRESCGFAHTAPMGVSTAEALVAAG
jgi:hypothetical protein